MATLVFFNAHPDDEAIGHGGVMAKAASEGHRIVSVFATRGEHGEVPDDVEGAGAPLAELRTQETMKAAEILGVSRVEFLDYVDSGMAGDVLNNQPDCFWQADLDEAAKKLTAILEEEEPEVFVFYDENGVYGHPDHVQVHRVGARAAEMVQVPNVFMSTVDQQRAYELFDELRDSGVPFPGGLDERPTNFGVPSERVTTRVNVEKYLPQKLAAMAAHASQIFEGSFFIGLPEPLSTQMWGLENYMKVGAPAGFQSDDLLAS
jgi:LmbE family N-acetylglucosaminyl deacetylase